MDNPSNPAPGTRRPPDVRRLVAALLIAIVAPACTGGGEEPADPAAPTDTPTPADTAAPEEPDGGVETRHEIGPRAVDLDRHMMLVVDSIAVSVDSIFVRVRVVNLHGEEWLDVGADDTFYGPLLALRDDLGNTYPARAEEPAGVYEHSIGRFELRLDGPLDPRASELTVELATQRGTLATQPFAPPIGNAVRWWMEAPAVSFSNLSVSDGDDRTVHVLSVVDRGTHVEVSIDASDTAPEPWSIDDLDATLTLADGTELSALPHDAPVAGRTDRVAGVLRFPGAVTGGTPAVLTVGGVAVEIPAIETPPSTVSEAPLADLPRLPDLIDAKIFNDPLPASVITIGAG